MFEKARFSIFLPAILQIKGGEAICEDEGEEELSECGERPAEVHGTQGHFFPGRQREHDEGLSEVA